MKQYVIIGNGVAAAGCVEGIRKTDADAAITVISKENHPVYCRPLISYYLEGKTTLDNMGYRAPDFYESNGCQVLYGRVAEKVDPAAKQVMLSDGNAISFDALCIATGSEPFVPAFAGLDTVKKRFSFMTLDDTLALEQAISAQSRVLIIGAGLIGLKCAEGLHGRVKSITVCDLADTILSSILDGETAPIVQRHLEKNGVEFLLSDTVERFEETCAVMKSGKTVEFDVLVTAVGVRPQVSLCREAGGTVGRGIVVDTAMRTDLADIYAAGDCTEGYDASLGAGRVLALLPNAYMQGFTAGVNMAGGDKTFDNAIPMNSIGFFGLHVMTAGSYVTPENGGKVYTVKEENGLKKFFVQDKVLKGYILIGCVERGGMYTALVRQGTPLDTLDFELLQKNPSFSAFSVENRRKNLGSVV